MKVHSTWFLAFLSALVQTTRAFQFHGCSPLLSPSVSLQATRLCPTSRSISRVSWFAQQEDVSRLESPDTSDQIPPVKQAFRQAWRDRFRGKGKPGIGRAQQAAQDTPTEDPAVLSDGNAGGEFLSGAALADLRARCRMLSLSLDAAVAEQRFEDAGQMRDRLRALRQQDPLARRDELRTALEAAVAAEDYPAAGRIGSEIKGAEERLAQFRLDGFWKGRYGSHGDEMIRVTYEGDELVAVKITGDKNIPAGKETFRADLSFAGMLGPLDGQAGHPTEKIRQVLERYIDGIQAFRGRGHVAEAEYRRPQWVEGRLVLFEEEGVFGFMWLPLGTLIVFEFLGPLHRPPPPLPPAGPAA